MATPIRKVREEKRVAAAVRRDPKLPDTPPHAEQLRALATTWAQRWGDVFRAGNPTPDVLAGVTVAAVALPLNLALAVASGLPPAAGLVAGAVGGGIAAIFGGSALQVTGPAAALTALVLAISLEFGPEGAAGGALLVGLVQVVLALTLAGRLMRFVPESVLAGFTTGVGLKLLDNQIPELMGFNYRVVELAQMMHRPAWLHEVSWLAVLSGVFVAFLVVATRPYKRFPAALVGIAVVTALSVYVDWDIERVGAMPSTLPLPSIPDIADSRWLDLFWRALPLGLIAGAESLLSAKAVDRMAPTTRPHDANLELFGQGLANAGAALFGGMPVSGVVVRSGVNAQSGGRTRLSALVHAGALLASILYLSESIARIPLAALAGLLIVVGMRLIEVGTLVELWKHHKASAIAFVVAAAGTVTGNLASGLALAMAIDLVAQYLVRRDTPKTAPVVRNRKGDLLRAVLPEERGSARQHAHLEGAPEHQNWLSQIRERAQIAASAFVHNQATVIGRVVLGEHVHIAAGSSVRADEGAPFFIGANSNIQDGVVIHALKERKVVVAGEEWAVYVGQNVSMAHDALVHGPCYIGDDTFIGFKAVVHDSVVGSHCFIGIGAIVVGVEIPDGRFVPHGRIVDSAEAVAALPLVSDAQLEFNEDVVDVNRGLAAAYRRAHGEHRPVLTGPAPNEPTIGEPAPPDLATTRF